MGKNLSLTSASDSVKIKYISGRQSSSYELTFGVELGPNPYSKNYKQEYSYTLLKLDMANATACFTVKRIIV